MSDRYFNFDWGKRTYLMGILNVTPDSFSDGGDFNTLETALVRAEKFIEAGVDIIDVGGQSSRPGADVISLEEELERVVPVIDVLSKRRNEILTNKRNGQDARSKVAISVDTTRAEVARAAVRAGADIVNDISGGTFEEEMLPVVAALGVPIVLMHIKGTPKTMQQLTDYKDLIGEIYEFLEGRIEAAVAAGIDRSKIIIDPGIGFAKTYAQNLEILRELARFKGLNCPILIGVSRKSFIGKILDRPEPKERVWGTAAACAAAIANSADIVRVHDVGEMLDVCRVADAIIRQKG
ncbi:MAG: dihydropteroate synthase [Cyanobacteriota bacterium]|nr:dihydropteroate synthase [Cyanobacteriota bacterium]